MRRPDLNEDYAITGTINSGGLMKSLGVDAKIDTAKNTGLKSFDTVRRDDHQVGNKTTDLKNLSKTIELRLWSINAERCCKRVHKPQIKQNFKA